MKNNNGKQIAIGVLLSVFVSVLMVIVTTFLIYRGSVPVESLKWFAVMISSISVLFGCIVGNLSGNMKPPVLCPIIAMVYTILQILVNWLFVHQMRRGWGLSLLVVSLAAILSVFISAVRIRSNRYHKYVKA